MLGAPCPGACRDSSALAQQKLAQAVSRAQLIALGRLPCTHQVAQSLVRRIRYPHRRELPGAVAARQLFGVAPIRLDPIPGLDRHQRGRHHLAVDPQLAQLPVQHVAGRPRLVAHPQLLRPTELAHQALHGFGTVGDHPKAMQLTARFGYRHCNRLRMDIQPSKSYLLHRRLPFVCGSAPRVLPDPKRNPRFANRGPVVPL